jgi:hypothetical protein
MVLTYLYSQNQLDYPDQFVTHASATGNISNLKLTFYLYTSSSIIDNDVGGMLLNYQINPIQKQQLKEIYGPSYQTLGLYINHVIDEKLSQTFIEPKNANNILHDAITMWFFNKSVTPPKRMETPTLINLEEYEKWKTEKPIQSVQTIGKKINIAVHLFCLQPFVNAYWNIIRKSIQSGRITNIHQLKQTPPKIEAQKMENINGLYDVPSHTIFY